MFRILTLLVICRFSFTALPTFAADTEEMLVGPAIPAGKYFDQSTGAKIEIAKDGKVTTNFTGSFGPIYFPNPLRPYTTRFVTHGCYDMYNPSTHEKVCTCLPVKFDVEYFADEKVLGLEMTMPGRVFGCSATTQQELHYDLNKQD